jgi:biopolymer transport protein ExbB/TolQ
MNMPPADTPGTIPDRLAGTAAGAGAGGAPGRFGAARQPPPLSWFRQDVEQRFGLKGGRFTSTNGFLTFGLAVVLTVGAYAAMLPFRDRYWVRMFTENGAVQYVTVLFSFWSAVILLFKKAKLGLQRRALRYELVPDQVDFVLSKATAGGVLERLHAVCDDPRQFVLFNRVEMALANLRNMGRISDFDGVLQSQAGNDDDVMESSYSLLKGLVWAIPVLGFIGTVQGLSQAVGQFGAVLTDSAEVGALKPALRGVTSGLAVAFETTFVALVAALAIQLVLTVVRKDEEQFLDECKEYCQRKLVGRLRITPFESGQ